jgi:hypothetical protein
VVLKYHRADYRRLPGEVAVRDALGNVDPAPGLYMTPFCDSMKELGEPAMKEKYEKGPVALITMRPKGMTAMGKYLGLWFGYSVLVSFTAAYVPRHTLQPGTAGMLVAQITGAVAFARMECRKSAIRSGRRSPGQHGARLMDT